MLKIGHTHRRAVLLLYLWAALLAMGAVSFAYVDGWLPIVAIAAIAGDGHRADGVAAQVETRRPLVIPFTSSHRKPTGLPECPTCPFARRTDDAHDQAGPTVTTSPASPAPAPNAPFDAMLRGALVPSIAAGLRRGGRAVGAAPEPTGGWPALLGVAVAVVFFAAGLYVMKRVVGANPLSVLAGALAVYLGQILFLGIIILVLVRRAAGWTAPPSGSPSSSSRSSGRSARWSPSCGCATACTTRRPRAARRARAGRRPTRRLPDVQRGRVDERLDREREELAMTEHDGSAPDGPADDAHPGYDRVAARETVVMYNALAYVLARAADVRPGRAGDSTTCWARRSCCRWASWPGWRFRCTSSGSGTVRNDSCR